MTNKDAIYYLQYLRHDVSADSPYDIALVTAINALSSGHEHKKLSNADRIRQMTDEELATFLNDVADYCTFSDCNNCPLCGACDDAPISILKWLKQEVKD